MVKSIQLNLLKDKFMDWMVNNIRLVWKLVCMWKTYNICNLMFGFSKYEFNSKLLSNIILFKVT